MKRVRQVSLWKMDSDLKLLSLIAAGMLTLATPVGAQTPSTVDAASHAASAASAVPMVDGEVRKVDRETGKLTLRHGPITNLDMPAMTMVFRVADLKLLDGLKEGDKVRFVADRVGGAFTVTAIESAR